MKKIPDAGHKMHGFELPTALVEQMKTLAERARRTLKEEVIHAFQRHIESPPIVTYQVDAPPMPIVQQVVTNRPGDSETPPKRPRGRPRKHA